MRDIFYTYVFHHPLRVGLRLQLYVKVGLNRVKRKIKFSKFTKIFVHFIPRTAGRSPLGEIFWIFLARKINDFCVECINILMVFQSDSTLFLLNIIKIIKEWNCDQLFVRKCVWWCGTHWGGQAPCTRNDQAKLPSHQFKWNSKVLRHPGGAYIHIIARITHPNS